MYSMGSPALSKLTHVCAIQLPANYSQMWRYLTASSNNYDRVVSEAMISFFKVMYDCKVTEDETLSKRKTENAERCVNVTRLRSELWRSKLGGQGIRYFLLTGPHGLPREGLIGWWFVSGARQLAEML